MRWIAVMCAGLLGCASSSEPEPVAQVRQAFPGLPEVVGEQGSLLGSSLATCPGIGFVAGAPGTGTAWHSTSSQIPSPVGAGLGRAVACQRLAGTAFMLAGGDAGLRKEVAGTWGDSLTTSSTLSISRSDDSTLPLLVGGVGSVKLYAPLTGISTTAISSNTNNAGFGSVVLWIAQTPRFLVSSSSGMLVQLYVYDTVTKTVSLSGTITNPAAGFGRALAVGNLSPEVGDEAAISAQGEVFIFSNTGVLLLRLQGTEQSFGASLAIQRNYALGVDALLVGEPTRDQVHRFVGDAGSIVSSGMSVGALFGASLAVDPFNRLAIGAPLEQGGGAVFFESLSELGRPGELRHCTAGAECKSRACVPGSCLGGVFCDTSGFESSCTQDETCIQGACVGVDAGAAVDAGFDAGVVRDAGVDAGRDDDAGVNVEPLSFSTSGCSQTAAVPMLLLALGVLRRRKEG